MLSAHQASILDHLDSVEGTSLQALAEHMGVKRSAMSIAVKRLVTRRRPRLMREVAARAGPRREERRSPA